MTTVRRFWRRYGPIPAICYLVAVVVTLLLVCGMTAMKFEEARIEALKKQGKLQSELIVLSQYETVLKYKVEELEIEVARRKEQVEQLDHQLGLRTLRAENCEWLNQALYNRDAEQREAIRACWNDKQWSVYRRNERTARREP